MNELNLISKVIFGSHLYGLETSESDIDFKGIYLPSSKRIVLGTGKGSYNYQKPGKTGAGEIDYEVYSLKHFIKLALSGETVAMDMLHADVNIVGDVDCWEYMKHNRTMFYSKSMNAFTGYARKQFLKYGLKSEKLEELEDLVKLLEPFRDSQQKIRELDSLLPNGKYCYWTKKRNKGTAIVEDFYLVNDKMIQQNLKIKDVYDSANTAFLKYGHRAVNAKNAGGADWKAISHALRIAYQLIDIYKDGDYEFPLKQTQYLKDIKSGSCNYEKVVGNMEQLMLEIEELAENSDLPEKADYMHWDMFLFNEYQNEVLVDAGYDT